MNRSWLRKVPLFEKLSGDELDEVLESASQRKFAKNDCIVKAETKGGDALYVIRKGRVKIVRKGFDGVETILAILGEGDFFGEMSLLDGGARSADVIAVEPVDSLAVDRNSFFHILRKYPSASINLLRILTGRLRASDARVKSSGNINTVGKVTTVLLALADFGGKRRGAAVLIEKIPSIAALARMAGVTKTAAGRVLDDLRKTGYLEIEGANLKITNYLSFKKILVFKVH